MQQIATITFPSVASIGTTTVTPLATSSGAPLPLVSHQLTPPVYYDINTTATYTGPVAVCLRNVFPQYPLAASLSLLHYTGGAWVNITTSYNATTRTTCGQASALSPLALTTPLSPTPAPTTAPTGVSCDEAYIDRSGHDINAIFP